MDRKKFLSAALLLLTIFSLTSCQTVRTSNGINSVKVDAVAAKMGVIDVDSVMTGKIEAIRSANLVTKVPGKVAAVHVDVGSEVERDQVLVSLNADDMAANIRVARATLDGTRVAYDLAEKQYARGKVLLAAQAISRTDYDVNYEGAYNKAKAALETAEATLDKAQIAYNEMFIKAPFAGIITGRNINEGELAISQNPLLTIVNLDQVNIKGYVDETEINRLQIGQEAKCKISAASPQPLTGKVAQISEALDPAVKGYLVKIKIDNPRHILKPGMFAEVRIAGQHAEGLLIPTDAVQSDEKGNYVFVLNQGIAQKRELETGISDTGNCLIISGINAGEMVVTAASSQVADGQKVMIRGDVDA